MTSLSFNSWAASGSKTIHLYNETGAPLNCTMPNVYTYSLDGLSFNGSPFTFSNTVWNCELRDNKSMTFNTRTTFGSMVSTTRTGTGLTVAGTNVFELLGDFCSATTRTNFNYRFVNRSATILSVR